MSWLWDLVKSLRLITIAIFVIGWNVLCYLSMFLNGGAGRIVTISSAVAMTVTCVLLAGLAFTTAALPTWQRIALRPDADPAAARPGLLFIGFLGTVLALGGLFTAYGILRGHA
jgi:hypothetical protein